MLFLVSLLPLLGLSLAAPSPQDPGYNCQPGQQCWPTPLEWQALNTSLSGALFLTHPLGEPCYPSTRLTDPETCSLAEAASSNNTSRGAHYGQTYWGNWEACGTSGCGLQSSDPSKLLYSSCSLGRLGSYYIDVRNASHISTALLFAKKHNIRISIKNTGHDFFGRSSVPNALAIWTHNLASLSYQANFTASNCPAADSEHVGEMGAGVTAGDAYRFFNAHGMDVTGGYEESVGIAGGFGMGGGVGDFTTLYGLMVDNAVEFEVVTADGLVRVINECNDPDLFWAMRGGGGGAFAVLTKYRVQLHPMLPIHTYNFVASFEGNTTETLRQVLTAHAENQLAWSEHLVTGGVD
ncbi:putative FAD-linked oxidoreductase, partial [Lachnellula suecica]